MRYATANKLEHIFLEAAKKLLSLLSHVGPPHQQREKVRFLFDLGKIHVSRALRLLKENQVEEGDCELLKAAHCHHASALCTHQFYPNRYMRFISYNALGETLVQLEDFEMAKRAFLWAASDPTAWINPNKVELSVNLLDLWSKEQTTQKEHGKSRKSKLKNKRAQLKKGLQQQPKKQQHINWCDRCKKKIKESVGDELRCARCLASYCSKDCQVADWPTHKSTCQSAPPRTQDLLALETFEAFLGPCSEGTQALMMEHLDWKVDGSLQAWNLTLTESARVAAAWSAQQAQLYQRFPATPQWLLDFLRST